jgi:hypothetical protein
MIYARVPIRLERGNQVEVRALQASRLTPLWPQAQARRIALFTLRWDFSRQGFSLEILRSTGVPPPLPIPRLPAGVPTRQHGMHRCGNSHIGLVGEDFASHRKLRRSPVLRAKERAGAGGADISAGGVAAPRALRPSGASLAVHLPWLVPQDGKILRQRLFTRRFLRPGNVRPLRSSTAFSLRATSALFNGAA